MTFTKLLFFLTISTSSRFVFAQNMNDELENYRGFESFVELKGGHFMMGINDREGINSEYPQRKAIVEPFRITLYPVTIASFKKYKKEKYKHRTDAELAGSSWVFKPLINQIAKLDNLKNTDDIESQEALSLNMKLVTEARWNKPEGGNSSIRDILSNPVVHVSYNDAFGYCAWRGMRLPTEIEWEYAARGGLKEKLYPWGDYWEIGKSNLWQGEFPNENQLRDGHYGLSPVNAFQAQNDFEMYDLIGNVWEWTSTIFRKPRDSNDKGDRRVLKGGSFLDTRDGDYRKDNMKIRVSSRIGRKQKFTAYNIGFRCAQTIRKEENVRYLNNGEFRVVKIRPPMHHNARPKNLHGEL